MGGLGDMVGFLANVSLSNTYGRKVIWPIIMLTVTVIPFVAVILYFKPPPEYTVFDNIKKL